jgi:hypothetical protein
MNEAVPTTGERSQEKVLIILGVLWLLMAAAIIVSQLSSTNPIKIEWQTATEVNTAGFNVYRASSEEGPFTRINPQLIPSEGSAVSGASYTFIDENVDAGQTYCYRLEDVELDNSIQQHETFCDTVPTAGWWVPVTVAFSVIAGLLLLVKGLRVEKSG